jgi:hypothetical protein
MIPGVVDQDVDLLLGEQPAGRVPHRVVVADVGADRPRLAAAGDHLVRDLVEVVVVSPEDDVRTRVGQRQGGGPADAVARPGDQGGPAVEREGTGHRSSSVATGSRSS